MEAIKDRMSKGKKPKAIISVHLYGMPAQMHKIMAIANEYDIPVVEDAAEALGSKIGDQSAGTFGLLGVLSFNGNKIITTSGGGALISENEYYIKKSRFLATQARDAAPHYQHSEIGYNYRMSNVCAAIGRGQMEVLDEHIQIRRNNFERYKSAFGNIEGITVLDEPAGSFSNRWLSTILVDPIKTNGITREDIRLALEKDNIESRPLWKPMHLQPVFERAPYYGGQISEQLFNNGLCLPSGSNLETADLERVIAVFGQLFDQSLLVDQSLRMTK
jgi:dTDP-4-amino-4,6-dideoxygalactose transaminase